MTDGRKNLDLSQTDQVFRSSSGGFTIFTAIHPAFPLAATSATADRVRRAPSLNPPGARPCLPLACNPMPGLCGRARDRDCYVDVVSAVHLMQHRAQRPLERRTL